MTLAISSDLINATAKKVTTTHGTYGDRGSESLGTAYNCRFRDFATVADKQNAQELTSDAMAWIDTDAGFIENDLIQITPNDGTTVKRFRITRIGHARGSGNTVQFDKAELERYHG